MTADIALRPQTRVTLPIGTCRFLLPTDDGYLFMSEQTGKNHVVPHETFLGWLADYKVRVHGIRAVNSYDRTPPLGPGEALTPQEMARAWYCRKWDVDPCPKSDRQLRLFVDHYASQANNDGVTHRPSPGALRRALSNRGEVGHRPNSVMRTRTGKVTRKPRVGPVVSKMLRRCALWYWSERGRDKFDAHARLARMVRLYNSLGAIRKLEGWAGVRLPSKETTRVYVNTAEMRETCRVKLNERSAKERFQGSKPTLTASRIMDTVVIDATVVDGWCVWRESTEMPLGRPTLYLAIDVRSRIVVAWFLSFEPPSLYGLMGLLKKIVTPNEHGIWGKLRNIVLDNGWENVSPSLLAACSSAGINTHYAPIGTPEYKAIVERAFGVTNKLVFHKLLGGAVPLKPHAMKAMGLDPEKTANVLLEDLEGILEQALREVHAKEKHGGTGEIPLVVWNKGLQDVGREVVGDLGELLVNFGQVETATLTRSGVVTKDGLRFSHPQRVTELLNVLGRRQSIRDRRKGSATATVKIVVDPEDISKVTVWDPVRKVQVILDNVHVQFARECSSRWEYRMVKALVDEECASFSTEEDRLRRRRKLRQMIEAASPVFRRTAAKRYRALLSKQKAKPEGGLVMAAEVEASVDGRKPINEVASVMAAVTAEGDGLPVKGVRRGGQAATDKQKATVARKKAEKAREQDRTEAETPIGVRDSGEMPDRTSGSAMPGDVSASARATAGEGGRPSEINPYRDLSWVRDAMSRARRT